MNFYTRELIHHWHLIRRVSKGGISKHSKITTLTFTISDLGFIHGMLTNENDINDETKRQYANRCRKLFYMCLYLIEGRKI